MFKCYDCGCTFDYFKTVKDYVGEYWGAPAYQDLALCPYCESENFDEYRKNEYEYEEEDDEDD